MIVQVWECPSILICAAHWDGQSRTLSNTWDADSSRLAMDANGSECAFVYDNKAGIPVVIDDVHPHERVV